MKVIITVIDSVCITITISKFYTLFNSFYFVKFYCRCFWFTEVQHGILVFWGTKDQFCPAQGVWKILERCARVQAEVLNRCGHWVMVEYPALFNQRCMAFMRDTAG